MPVHTDADGVVRVSGTRVTLETIVGAFDAGATPEEIAQQYSSVPPKDIYAVIAYCLQHEPEVGKPTFPCTSAWINTNTPGIPSPFRELESHDCLVRRSP